MMLIDIGHSRIKLGEAHQQQVRHCRAFPLEALEEACAVLRDGRQAGQTAYGVSTLRGAQETVVRQRIEAAWDGTLVWIGAAQAQGFLQTHYTNPETFGADRLLALRAARRRTAQSCIVVDAGTAVTVDGLDETHTHAGGWIVPGYEALRQNLSTLLEVAPRDSTTPSPLTCSSTAQATETGIWRLLAGGVEQMCTQLRTGVLGDEAEIFVTGGDAESLCAWSALPMQQVPDLVLEGLAECAGER